MDQDSNEVRSSIPSRMKRRSIWEVNTGEALTTKRRIMVSTKQKVEDEVVASVNHITITEVTKEDSFIEDDAEGAPPTFEEGVQATVDELKEVNIGTIEDPRPIFINANLSLEEEDAYVELLEEYKDVFAWTYKEMPGLDPKVAIHHLSIGMGCDQQSKHSVGSGLS